MQTTIKEVLNPRWQRKCYIIETQNDEFIIIYGTRYRKVVHGNELYDRIRRFEEGHIKWDRLKSSIVGDRNDGAIETGSDWWNPLNKEYEKTNVNIIALYIDGEKKLEL